MKARPYAFTATWEHVAQTEIAGAVLHHYDGRAVLTCRTADAVGVLACDAGGSWSAMLMDPRDEGRCYWSTSYRHQGETLDRAAAQDLCEAALIGASIFGLEVVGRPGSGCCP